MENRQQGELRSKLDAGIPVLGTFCFAPCPSLTEAIGLSGLDFVIIDMEHSPKDWSTVENMIRAAEVAGTSPLVRIPYLEESLALHALDLGATGLVLPFVETADDVKRSIDIVRYPPLGRRHVCTATRASRYGFARSDFAAAVSRANSNIVVFGLIESTRATENLQSIVELTPGLDGVVIARADLSGSLGVPGETTHPRVLQLAEQVVTDLGRYSPIPFGISTRSPAESIHWAELGARILVYGSDISILASLYRNAVSEFNDGVEHPASASTQHG